MFSKLETNRQTKKKSPADNSHSELAVRYSLCPGLKGGGRGQLKRTVRPQSFQINNVWHKQRQGWVPTEG